MAERIKPAKSGTRNGFLQARLLALFAGFLAYAALLAASQPASAEPAFEKSSKPFILAQSSGQPVGSSLPQLFRDEDEEAGDGEAAPVDDRPIDFTAPGVANCPNAAPDAYIFVPGPIHNWAQLICQPDGHYLVPVEGNRWWDSRNQPFQVQADTLEQQLTASTAAPYFTEMAVQEFGTEGALKMRQLLQQVVERTPVLDGQVNYDSFNGFYRLYMKTKGQVQIDLYFFVSNDVPQWFVYCEQQCGGQAQPQAIRVETQGLTGLFGRAG